MLIAIDTSTTQTGLACYDQGGVLGECLWQSGRNHTAQVLPQLAMLLRHIGRSQRDLRAVAVALGPGSWSGLRVGMSIAKGLAWAGNLAIIGIGTLEVLAFQHQRLLGSVYPMIRLGRGRFATAEFCSGETWRRVSDDRNVTLAELCREVLAPSQFMPLSQSQSQVLFCGDILGDEEAQEYLRQHLKERACFPAATEAVRRPGVLAHLAWQRLVAQDCDDLTRLEPRYLGEPVQARKA
ncbi:MAG: tRNA (adenosine(37)-N6)-threonylcarbamoyltransferase complex dimerization subunit type 1 TsaB [Chloroflexaceae bacterium]|nr:tRNA (adenosine(37)-N6)-threonylcarbamoyltransferase complex dimerization subunit type 1 TsaB [Chloroflexaceae bacterium]